MSGPDLYQMLLAGGVPDETGAAADLSDRALCRLTGWLAQNPWDENGPSGRVMGICLVEMATRFARNMAHRTSNIEHRREEQES